MIISAAPLYSATRLVRGHSMDRVQTHVEGFDEALGGGIPRGSIVLVAGSRGTMKTALTFSMLYATVKAGSKTLYISLEESQEDLRAAMAELGMTGLDGRPVAPSLREDAPHTARARLLRPDPKQRTVPAHARDLRVRSSGGASAAPPHTCPRASRSRTSWSQRPGSPRSPRPSS